MNESKTIEVEIKSTAQQAKTSVDSLVKSLTNVENVLTNMYLELGTIEKKSTNSLQSIDDKLSNLKKTTNKTTESTKKFSKALSLGSVYIGAKRITSQFLDWMQLSVDYTEQLNLFNVVFKNVEKDGVKTFSTLGREATKYQNKLNEAFGTNQQETLKYQALYQSMGENAGISDGKSAIMSQTMTNLTYDLASLYNKSESATAEAIRAGVYAGQTKPLRNFGIDVTQTTMQPVLESLGIDDRTVKQLSQGEKQILRYIATLKQAQVAMGDYANTIESPANQQKVFANLLVESKVALTSLFIGTFEKILPYVNAFLMVVKEVSTSLATMMGIKITDYNSGIASQSDTYSILSDNVDDATDSVEELKRQTLGFDQINNISENKDNNKYNGIDQRLLDAISTYDNGMENVKMKATGIRDSIMEWLGFTKKINEETGEVSFEFDKITGGTIAGGSFVGLIVGGTLLKGISSLRKAVGLLKGTPATGTGGALAGGSGLAGLLPFLVTIAGIWTISLYVDGYNKVKESLTELDGMLESNTMHSNDLKDGQYKLSDAFWEAYNSGSLNTAIMDNYKNSLGSTTDEIVKQYEELEENKTWWGDFLGQNEELSEQQRNLAYRLGAVTQDYEKLYNQGMLNNEQAIDYKESLEKQIEIMDQLGMDTMDLKTKYKNLTGNDYNLTIEADIEDNTGNFFTRMKDKIRNLLNLSNYGGGNGSFGGGSGGGTRANGGIYSNGTWKNISQYANGGVPSHGSMFVAGENGAEVVGHINGRTEVLNQSQIASAIYSAVLNAMSQVGNSTQVDVRVHSDNSVVVDEINQTTKQTGICPIVMPAQ